jgi:hypothetical protein
MKSRHAFIKLVCGLLMTASVCASAQGSPFQSESTNGPAKEMGIPKLPLRLDDILIN